MTPGHQLRFRAVIASEAAICIAALALLLVRGGTGLFADVRLVDLAVLCILAVIGEVVAVLTRKSRDPERFARHTSTGDDEVGSYLEVRLGRAGEAAADEDLRHGAALRP